VVSAYPLYRASKREREGPTAKPWEGEGIPSAVIRNTLTPHRHAMGTPLPLQSAEEGFSSTGE
jgi:hypothetical protein